jgi:hypothetical protein
LVIDGVFTLLHTITDHAGYSDTLIMLSPNQPVRYEIRSSTGAGSLVSVCSQVATEGATPDEQGEGISFYTGSLPCNATGTIYALCGGKKQVAYRNHFVSLDYYGATIASAANDAGVLLLLVNPTLSTPLTYTNTGRIQGGVAASGTTVTNTGRILRAIPMTNSTVLALAPSAALRNLPIDIDNTLGELVVAYQPLTSNQTISAAMTFLEY